MVLCSICNCNSEAVKRGWCGKHYRRWQRHKTTDLLPKTGPTDIERFWSKVDKNGPTHPIYGQCWVWTGYTNNRTVGYGLLRASGKNSVYAHRFSYEIHFSKPSNDLFVCHHCDNKKCVNPSHLFLGTLQDNTNDKVSKNRQLKGEEITNSKLTSNDVLLIRELYRRGQPGRSLSALAIKFRVSMQLIHQIVTKKIWRHLLNGNVPTIRN